MLLCPTYGIGCCVEKVQQLEHRLLPKKDAELAIDDAGTGGHLFYDVERQHEKALRFAVGAEFRNDGAMGIDQASVRSLHRGFAVRLVTRTSKNPAVAVP